MSAVRIWLCHKIRFKRLHVRCSMAWSPSRKIKQRPNSSKLEPPTRHTTFYTKWLDVFGNSINESPAHRMMTKRYFRSDHHGKDVKTKLVCTTSQQTTQTMCKHYYTLDINNQTNRELLLCTSDHSMPSWSIRGWDARTVLARPNVEVQRKTNRQDLCNGR